MLISLLKMGKIMHGSRLRTITSCIILMLPMAYILALSVVTLLTSAKLTTYTQDCKETKGTYGLFPPTVTNQEQCLWLSLTHGRVSRRLYNFCYWYKVKPTSARTLFAFLILLMCGDVETNPGPVRFPCGVCEKPVATNQRAMQCDSCDSWVHIKCDRMSTAEYNLFAKHQWLAWECWKCNMPNLTESFFEDSISTEIVSAPCKTVSPLLDTPLQPVVIAEQYL